MISETNLILDLIQRGGIRQTESELRHQLGKRDHPLAESRDLYKRLVMVNLERAGLLTTELALRLTDDGRVRLLDGKDSSRAACQERQEGREGS